MKKDFIPETIDSVSKNLPKTKDALDNVLSSVINVVDTLLFPFQAAKLLKDAKIESLKRSLAIDIEKIPEENRKKEVELNIVGPAIESLKYTIQDDELRDLFEKLLVSTLDNRKQVFPSFVEIIRQLSPDEAKLLKELKEEISDYPLVDVIFDLKDGKGSYYDVLQNYSLIGKKTCEKKELIPTYLIELQKFGLILINDRVHLGSDILYTKLEQEALEIGKEKKYFIMNGEYRVNRKKFSVTAYGKLFLKACVFGQVSENGDK